MQNTLYEGATVVDCTLGNGNDTLYAKELIGETGKVYGFDIQQTALDKSKDLLVSKGYDSNVEFILDGHEHLDQYIEEEVDLVMFNLGFLPGGNKEITTNANKTIEALKKAFQILKSCGIITMIFYPGHEEGKNELIKILEALKMVSQKEFDIHHGKFINQVNNPPEYVVIQKKTR